MIFSLWAPSAASSPEQKLGEMLKGDFEDMFANKISAHVDRGLSDCVKSAQTRVVRNPIGVRVNFINC